MTAAGSAGTAADRYKVEPPTGRHRAPPTVPAPRAPAVIAVAAAVLTAASLTAIAGAAVAPDASGAASQVSTVTRADRTTAGPLELPTIGAEGAWSPPETTEPAQSPVTVAQTPVRTQRPASTVQASTEPLVTQESTSGPTVTPAPQPVTTQQAQPTPTTPLADAAVTTDSATPTSEETPTVTATAAATSTPRRTGKPR